MSSVAKPERRGRYVGVVVAVFACLAFVMNAAHIQRVADRTTPKWAKWATEPVLEAAVAVGETTHLGDVRDVFERLRGDILDGGADSTAQVGGERYLIAGDSVMENLVPQFTKTIEERGGEVRKYIQRGSTVGDPFVDWGGDISRAVREWHIDVVVLMVDVRSADLEKGSKEAIDLTQRVLEAGARRVVWLEHPAVRNTEYEKERQARYASLLLAEKEVEGLLVLDPGRALVSSQGGYASFVVDENGRRVRVRERDGVHLTPEGARIVVQAVIDQAGL